jgi:hypothetical protein
VQKFFQQAVSIDACDETIFSELSFAQRMLGNVEQALENAETAIKLKPDFAKVTW